jgi:pectin lyase
MIWIDHLTISKIGRQHIVAGDAGAGRVTISNTHFDGRSEKSATCNGQHYWNQLLIGKSSDQFTFMGNHFQSISGRGPKVGSGTIVHAVNNVWTDIDGHAFETESGAIILAEGNVFDGVETPIKEGGGGSVFAANDAAAAAQCEAALGRACEVNSLTGAGPFEGAEASVLGSIKNPAPAVAASDVKTSVVSKAGAGKL